MTEDHQIIKLPPPAKGYWPNWLSWRPTSMLLLHVSESKILTFIKNKIELFYVPIKKGSSLIRTLRAVNVHKANKNEEAVPIVLLHGMGAGLGFWCKNIDALSEQRTLYAMDLLGFGRSSRIPFPTDTSQVETTYVQSIEEWREKLGVQKFILLGHSMGGYLAYAYACKYPNRVRHLILADPWGFSQVEKLPIRRAFTFMKNLNPLSPLRISGPFGPYLVKRVRPDLGYYFNYDHKCSEICAFAPEEIDHIGIYDYIYHCNAQSPSSGESAFKCLCKEPNRARFPMVERIHELHNTVPITFLYGEESWMDAKPASEFYEKRKNSYVDVQIIPRCGHHIYAEDSNYFNERVTSICHKVDTDQDHDPLPINLDMCQQSRHRYAPKRSHQSPQQSQSNGDDVTADNTELNATANHQTKK